MTHDKELGLSLKDLGLQDWNKMEVSEDCFVFWNPLYKPEESKDGFEFCCVNLKTQVLTKPVTKLYEVIFEGTCVFDGLRHLYFGKEETDNYGYLYCQDLPLLIKALKALDGLVLDNIRYVRAVRATV